MKLATDPKTKLINPQSLKTFNSLEQRLTLLIIIIGTVMMITAFIAPLFVNESGLRFSNDGAALDTRWLGLFGLVWIVVGGLIWSWLGALHRSPAVESATKAEVNELHEQITALQTQLKQIEVQFHTIQVQLDKINRSAASSTPTISPILPITVSASADSLNHEIASLSTLVHEAHKRLDQVEPFSHQVNDLEKQLDDLYVTVQDIHMRIDKLE